MALENMITPDLGGATDVTVIEILVKPGDQIEIDAPLITLESDKATLDIPAMQAGVIKEVKVKVGEKVTTGSVLVTLETASSTQPTESPKVNHPTTSEPPKPAAEKPATQPAEKPSTPQQSTQVPAASQTDVHAGPGVRRFARELGVDLMAVTGSGPKQRILKEDVQAYVKKQLTAPQGSTALFAPPPTIDFAKFGEIETRALSRIKKISGKNLQRNWMMIPHVTQFNDADITDLEAFRQAQKAALDKQKIKLTPLVFIMKAAVAALKAFPNFNASLDGAGENLILKKYYHIGVAVDTPEGLMVPVVRDVDKKGLLALAQELAVISEKARDKKLTPNEMQGGCFSISSLGGIGGTAFTPIINFPEVAILGVSKSTYKPVYEAGAFVPRLVLPLSLSYDHRVVDGAEGARFIVYLSQMLSDIRHLLL